jgi:hypothetical protein
MFVAEYENLTQHVLQQHLNARTILHGLHQKKIVTLPICEIWKEM